ncbi:hypothetical protein RvY_01672 [Ramazzottius varieornatus]|uniref:DDE-1 domain-containing protein n=1 Tax=Ramazzottius varieornatus TaxID=947166 RepID=A0A1D1UP72_RAMVA|nr:hypothetical protein RvY_01672 [Ramazzottius varieornatus]
MTGKYQPLDMSVNGIFKQFLKVEYRRWRRENISFTAAGYIKKPGKNEFIQMASSAWKKVDVEVVKKFFYVAELLRKSDVLPEFNEITWLWFPTTCERNRCELTTDAKCLADRSSRYDQTASVSGNKSCKRSKSPSVCIGETVEEDSNELELSLVKDSSFFEEETNDSDTDMEAEEEEDEDN